MHKSDTLSCIEQLQYLYYNIPFKLTTDITRQKAFQQEYRLHIYKQIPNELHTDISNVVRDESEMIIDEDEGHADDE